MNESEQMLVIILNLCDRDQQQQQQQQKQQWLGSFFFIDGVAFDGVEGLFGVTVRGE